MLLAGNGRTVILEVANMATKEVRLGCGVDARGRRGSGLAAAVLRRYRRDRGCSLSLSLLGLPDAAAATAQLFVSLITSKKIPRPFLRDGTRPRPLTGVY